MTREEFIDLLKSNNIDPAVVTFDDPMREGYVVRKNYFRWEVFYRERGKEYNAVGYPSESDALKALADKLIR